MPIGPILLPWCGRCDRFEAMDDDEDEDLDEDGPQSSEDGSGEAAPKNAKMPKVARPTSRKPAPKKKRKHAKTAAQAEQDRRANPRSKFGRGRTGGPPKTRETYERMVALYRGNPAAHSLVAREIGSSRDFARDTFERGWRGLFWAKPIREALVREASRGPREEAEEQRAREREEEELERERIRHRKAVERETELLEAAARSVKAAVLTVQGMAGAVAEVLQGVKEHTKNKAAGVSLRDCLRVLTTFANANARTALSADTIVKLSRLDRGLTTGHVSLERTKHEETVENAIDQLREASAILEAHEERLLAGMDPGGENDTDIPDGVGEGATRSGEHTTETAGGKTSPRIH